MPCHKTATDVRVQLKQDGERLGTIQARHPDVQQHQVDVRARALIDLDGVPPVRSLQDSESILPQADIEQTAHRGVIIDYQDAGPARSCSRYRSRFCGGTRIFGGERGILSV